METFLFAVNAILPIILLTAFGYILKRIHFFDDYFLNTLNKYIFRIGLPILLFFNVYNINNLGEIDWGIILFSVLGIAFIFVTGLIIVPLISTNQQKKGVLLQSMVRSNFAILGIPLAGALGGAEALAIFALISAFAIPMMNILSVVSLTLYQKDDLGAHISFKAVFVKVLKNPLIIGVMLGLFVLFIRSFIPVSDGVLVFSIKNQLSFIYEPLRWISQTASPLALIALGGQFDLSTGRKAIKEITIGVTLRIVIMPIIILGIAIYISSFYPSIVAAYPALIALFAAPIAISSVVMAYEMGGDYKLANQLVVWSTLFSVITLFIIIVTFRTMGAL
jgi:malate permease and related proteins